MVNNYAGIPFGYDADKVNVANGEKTLSFMTKNKLRLWRFVVSFCNGFNNIHCKKQKSYM